MSYVSRVTIKFPEERPLCETLLWQHNHHYNTVHGQNTFYFSN